MGPAGSNRGWMDRSRAPILLLRKGFIFQFLKPNKIYKKDVKEHKIKMQGAKLQKVNVQQLFQYFPQLLQHFISKTCHTGDP